MPPPWLPPSISCRFFLPGSYFSSPAQELHQFGESSLKPKLLTGLCIFSFGVNASIERLSTRWNILNSAVQAIIRNAEIEFKPNKLTD